MSDSRATRVPFSSAERSKASSGMPIIYFLGIAPGRYQALIPTFISGWDAKALKARVTFGLPDQHTLEPPENSLERRYALRAVKQRLHQASFRVAVITACRARSSAGPVPRRHPGCWRARCRPPAPTHSRVQSSTTVRIPKATAVGELVRHEVERPAVVAPGRPRNPPASAPWSRSPAPPTPRLLYCRFKKVFQAKMSRTLRLLMQIRQTDLRSQLGLGSRGALRWPS